MLRFFLKISDEALFKQEYVAQLIDPYIDTKSGKPRLIEVPTRELRSVQRRLKNILGNIIVPDNVFSGIKKRSYAQNADWHKGNKYIYKIDLTAFFPSISREKVYSFFRKDLETSPDVSEFLTNIATINIDLSNCKSIELVNAFLKSKKVKTRNHLISGSPTSQILSYMVNHNMFDEIQKLADQNKIVMTIYVDDITFSSDNFISNHFKYRVLEIIKKYGYQVSIKKVKSYSRYCPKLVTGVIIGADGRLKIKNSLRYKIILELEHLKSNPEDIESRQKLRGLVTAARQVERYAYPSIRQFAFVKRYNV